MLQSIKGAIALYLKKIHTLIKKYKTKNYYNIKITDHKSPQQYNSNEKV